MLNHYGFDFDYRSLVEACNEGDISKVRKLLDEGRVSVHDTTEEGESLLSLACSAGYFELAQVNGLSLRHGLLVKLILRPCNHEDKLSNSCVLLKVLLAMRANVEDRGMKGDCTPLMEAASAGHNEIVKLLLSHNAEVNAQSSSGIIKQMSYSVFCFCYNP